MGEDHTEADRANGNRCYWLLVGQFGDSPGDRTKSVLTAIGVATGLLVWTTAVVLVLEGGSNLETALLFFSLGLAVVVVVYAIAIGRLDGILRKN